MSDVYVDEAGTKDLSGNKRTFDQRRKEIDADKASEERSLKESRRSPFTNFYQINKDHSEDLMWLIAENPTAYRILLFLLDHMDKYNAVMCSHAVLSDYFGLSRSTVSRAVKLLKEKNFVYIYKSGTTNVYVTNPDIAWNSWGTNRKFCQFPANVVMTMSEQQAVEVADTRIKATVKVKG